MIITTPSLLLLLGFYYYYYYYYSIAKRVGLEALDAFDTQVRDIDLLLEEVNDQYNDDNYNDEDDDETTDGRSDPIIPFQNEYFSIDNNNTLYRQEQQHNSIEYQENIPPSPIHYAPPESPIHYHHPSAENSLHNHYHPSASPVEYVNLFLLCYVNFIFF